MANAVGIFNGNFRGGMYYEYRKQIEADTMREAIEAAQKFRGMMLDVCQELRDNMTQAEYDAWWKQTPDNDRAFFDAACAKLLALKLANANDYDQTVLTAAEQNFIRDFDFEAVQEVEM